MTNLLDCGPNDNTEPHWFVLHGGKGAQRRRWGPDMQRLASDLLSYGWVIFREGRDVVAMHRSRIEGALQ